MSTEYIGGMPKGYPDMSQEKTPSVALPVRVVFASTIFGICASTMVANAINEMNGGVLDPIKSWSVAGLSVVFVLLIYIATGLKRARDQLICTTFAFAIGAGIITEGLAVHTDTFQVIEVNGKLKVRSAKDQKGQYKHKAFVSRVHTLKDINVEYGGWSATVVRPKVKVSKRQAINIIGQYGSVDAWQDWLQDQIYVSVQNQLAMTKGNPQGKDSWVRIGIPKVLALYDGAEDFVVTTSRSQRTFWN